MAYREKIAWLTLVCMAITYTLYFSLIAGRPPGNMFDIIKLFGGVTIVQAAVVVAGSAWIAIRAGGNNARIMDERDRAIARRGATVAYYVLLVGMILVAVVMPFTETAWKIVNTGLLAIVIAEAVRLILILLSYRRGWHG